MNSATTGAMTTALLDVGQALELIEWAIEQRRAHSRPAGARTNIVSSCLQRAGVDKTTADRAQRRRLRDLYASRSLPVHLTLGAAVALDAAQPSEWLGFPDDEVLTHAVETSSRLPGLLSDRAWHRLDLSTNSCRTS
jgi:hypothetical protein